MGLAGGLASNGGAGSGGGSGTVTSVTAGDSTITVAGTGAAPTVAVNAIAESKVTGLVTDLGLKAPLDSPTFTTALHAANPTFTGTVVVPATSIANASLVTTQLIPANNLSEVTAATALANLGGAPLASPTFTGSPVVPGYAPLASPTFTGTPIFPATSINMSALVSASLRPTAALAETILRDAGLSGLAAASGSLYLSAIALPAGLTIGHIAFISTGVGQTLPNNWWFALYNSAFLQLAITADQTTTVWAANTLQSLAIATIASGASSTFVTTYSGLHYLGIMQKVTTTTAQPSGISTASGSGTANLAPVLGGISDLTQTTPPNFPHTATSLTGVTSQFRFYGYVAV